MKLRLVLLLAIIALFAVGLTVWGQVDSFIGQFTDSTAESFAGSVSGDGRFVVFESRGNLATENPENADNNVEIFLWDFAQRRIFQITRTKAVLINHFGTATPTNIRIDITNKRPMISNDGKWIAFASNAYSATPCGSNSTNPGNFDGNACTSPVPTPTPIPPSPTPSPTATPTSTPNNNPLLADANLEIWMYRIPDVAPADLNSGEDVPLTNLSAGTFMKLTDTPASRLPFAATASTAAFVADDNHDVSISDHGEAVSFTSTRDIIIGANSFPANDNDEIFVFRNLSPGSIAPEGSSVGIMSQVTLTARGPISSPIYNKNSSISGDGTRVVFSSTGDDPVPSVQPVPAPTASPVPIPPAAFDCGTNPAATRNEEIFYVTLATNGAPSACRQVTTTTPTNPGDPINILDVGRRISRDGRYVAFDSFADLANENSPNGANYTSFGTYVFDSQAPAASAFRRLLPRSDADSSATGGDGPRYPGFTDTNEAGTPATVVFETRLNIKPDGTMAVVQSEGLNPDESRPVQIYRSSAPLQTTAPLYTRLTKFPVSNTLFSFTQPLPSNTSERLAFNLALTELGTGNIDGQSEVYYLYVPAVTTAGVATFNFATGASRQTVSASPAPTPTATVSPTPTPTPTATPTPTGSPTPPPVTPPNVQGLSPGSVAMLDYDSNQPVIARFAQGSLGRRFTLPISLSGVTMSINGLACGLKSVGLRSDGQTQIVFVIPTFISSAAAGTSYPVVVNNNGVAFKGNLTIVPTRPDIFTNLPVPGPYGRTVAFNVTNRVPTTEPFTVTTVKLRGGMRVPTILRVSMTGIANLDLANAQNPGVFSIRIGNQVISGTTNILTGGVLTEPGVYTVDFRLPGALNMAGDQPIVVSVTVGGTTFTSRLDDTASRISFL